MSIDEFDTPPLLAAKLLRVADMLCEYRPRTVADFAVGTGELLAAAKLRWPQAAIFGCDISNDRVRKLARARTDWTVHNVISWIAPVGVPSLNWSVSRPKWIWLC